MRGLLFKLSGVLVLVGCMVAGWFAYEYQAFLRTPLSVGDQPQVIDIAPGSSLTQIATQLQERGLIGRYYLFVWAVRASGKGQTLKAGEYRIEPDLTPPGLIDLLVSGRVVQHPFTIVEGWRFAELRAELRQAPRLTHTLDDADDAEVMVRIGAAGQHPEGRFLPDTYHFPAGTTDTAFLRRAHRAMQQVLDDEWQARSKDLPLDSPEDALILASIIEKETGVAMERGAIAGVFVRRLQRGMRLETDPTVIYGVGQSFDGNLTRAHLRTDTAYNTYTRYGLPPTPIALPGRAAIHAALHPEQGDALYFVARGDGTHQFSATYAEHRKAVVEFQLRRRSTTAASQ